MGNFSEKIVPLRQGNAEDSNDSKRIEMVRGGGGWGRYDDLLRNYNRQVEENVRMLSGQQYSIYHPVLQRWLDVTDWMDEDERRWRQRPVFNRLLPWYMVTHARATENPPIVTFVPGPDRIDAELAEVLDISQKTLWRELGMTDKHDLLMGWVIVAGRGHLLTRVDPTRGPLKPWIGMADVPYMIDDGSGELQPQTDPNTGEVITEPGVEGIPHDKNGMPLAHIAPDGILTITGEPHMEREGTLHVDVLSPLQVRGSWGPQPWHDKREHYIRTFHTPEEVYDMTGMEVEPDVRGSGVTDVGELERILFGTGFFGSHDQRWGSQLSAVSSEGYVELTQRWQAPSPYAGMEETEESAGGRFTLCSRTTVLYDGVRPGKFPYTSPLNTFEFVRIPGRPVGTTPQEALNPAQRAYNDGYARIKEHVNLSTNPKGIIDTMSGIKSGQFTNAPGENYVVTRRPGVPALEFVSPPPLGEDVYKLQEMLLREITEIGQLQNSSSELPRDASGELIKELRFDDDRFLGPTMRRAVEEYGRFIQNMQVFLPMIWDEQKILNYAGDDNVARTIVVMPYMFEKGKVNVVPDVESMLPEGRGERAQQVYRMYMDGLLDGPPGTPEAIKKFYELAHFPHLSRTAKPGGIDRVTAEQENGQLVQGEDPRNIPVFEWYNHEVHIGVLEQFMKSPEFKKQPPPIQDAFVFHRRAHMMYLQMQQAQALQAAVAQQAAMNPQRALGPGGNGGGAPPGNRSLQPPAAQPPKSEPASPTAVLPPGLP